MTTIYFWTILVYLVALLWVGFRGSRDVRSQEDFSVAGRRLNTFVLSGTLLATWIGTGSIFGNAEKTYRVGLAALMLPCASLVGIGLLYFLAGRARALQQITIQDLLETRYNATARVFGVVTLVIAYTTIVSYQYRAGGVLLNLAMPGLPVPTSEEMGAGDSDSARSRYRYAVGMRDLRGAGGMLPERQPNRHGTNSISTSR